MTLDSLRKCAPPDQTTRSRNLFVHQKEYCAAGTETRNLDIDSRLCPEIEKSFVQAKFIQLLCIWTKHVSHENNSAIVIPTITGYCATHCHCFQKCHTCKQQKIDSCGDL